VKLAVVTSSPPGVEGGHLVIARALVGAARELGHDASLVLTPDYGFGRTLRTYLGNRFADIGSPDRVVSLRYPSYAVRHASQVCWLNHTMREYYDLWPRFAATLSPLNTIKEQTRRTLIHAADNYLLHRNVREVVAQSATVRDRLRRDFNIEAAVLHPPAPPRAYRCDGYEPFLFCASRLVNLKRVDLVLRALAQPPARGVRLVVAGAGEGRNDLEKLADTLKVADRVMFMGHVDEDTLVDYFARCRAVVFAPLAEDYGFVVSEAFASRKPVITCSDSGGPTELVTDGVSGVVVPPDPAALAMAMERLMDDERLAEQMGKAGAEQMAKLNWSTAVSRLVAP
jgi:glycosyltransferase involved in cell wall biosynthesis